MEKNYKILGFQTLHYGAPYLKESLLSVEPYVDKMVISYSAKPSQGFASGDPCPDTADELYEICRSVLWHKLIWLQNDGGFPNEGYHRDMRYNHSEGFDCILSIDSDEIMVGIPEAIDLFMSKNVQYGGVDGYVNFFRSFDWVLRDGFRPIRLENLHHKNGIQDLSIPLTVYHFSTALPEKYMRYKYKNFGHANEIKSNYLDDIFYKWNPDDPHAVKWLHPTSQTIWEQVEPFDKTTLPEYLKQNQFFNQKLIV